MTTSSNQNKAYFFAALTIIMWSTVPTAIKLGVGSMGQFQLLTGAAFTSVFVLITTLVVQRKTRLILSVSVRQLIRSAGLGLLNPFIYYLILFKAYSLLPGQVAQPLNMIWPLLLVLISAPMLGQNLSFRSIVALLISFAGVVSISFQGGNLLSAESNISGIFLALLTAVIWAFYWVLNMKSKLDDVVNLFYIFLFSSIYLLITSIFIENPFPVSLGQWGSAAYIGIFEMGLSFVFWLTALQLSESTAKISNLVYLAPFLNLIFVHLFLGEEIFVSTILGIFLIIAGIIYQNRLKIRNATR